MNEYIVILGILFLLAITDLIVGVSNDAVNFLNSAIGSKVASKKVILSIASIGIVIGALFSSGIMEVAQKGVFHPSQFTFEQIMLIFLAVMLTDVLLLDVFNSFGMPTSTTVSIVFELLGAAFAIAALQLYSSNESIETIGKYINSNSALAIILGIFLSVGIAFTIGASIQFFTRFVFTFNYTEKFARWGFIVASTSLSALTYFMVIKGLKGTSFLTTQTIAFVEQNTIFLLGVTFLGWLLVAFVLQKILRVNLLKLIVLVGTFSLAMAFAGNDLVNFIGVPIAGLNAFLAWNGSGVLSSDFHMNALEQSIQTDSTLLIAAGGIMVVTLWFSKKAQSVTETEVNLAHDGEHSSEKFSPNQLAIFIVTLGTALNTLFKSSLPTSWLQAINVRFNKEIQPYEQNKAAFDLLRASVNLTVASMLIALATSFKLPLSTTYVSFMVAMGTSLADRAWSKESATYRVSGVITVIGGWFLTAFIAFFAGGILAITLSISLWLIIPILALLALSLKKSNEQHKKLSKA